MRWLGYLWSFSNTFPGLVMCIITLATGGTARVVSGVLEVEGGFAALALRRLVPLPGGASAITLGHVVLARNQMLLEKTRRHERVHVRQAERWGPLFIPLYLTFSLIAVIRGGNAYRDNPFEREAFAIAD